MAKGLKIAKSKMLSKWQGTKFGICAFGEGFSTRRSIFRLALSPYSNTICSLSLRLFLLLMFIFVRFGGPIDTKTNQKSQDWWYNPKKTTEPSSTDGKNSSNSIGIKQLSISYQILLPCFSRILSIGRVDASIVFRVIFQFMEWPYFSLFEDCLARWVTEIQWSELIENTEKELQLDFLPAAGWFVTFSSWKKWGESIKKPWRFCQGFYFILCFLSLKWNYRNIRSIVFFLLELNSSIHFCM